MNNTTEQAARPASIRHWPPPLIEAEEWRFSVESEKARLATLDLAAFAAEKSRLDVQLEICGATSEEVPTSDMGEGQTAAGRPVERAAGDISAGAEAYLEAMADAPHRQGKPPTLADIQATLRSMAAYVDSAAVMA
jgi:hypothetical protein